MNHCWRLAVNSESEADTMVLESCLLAPAELYSKLRPRHCVVLAQWNEAETVGNVVALGVVLSVNVQDGSAKVCWARADITLKPNSSGRQFWRNKPFFKFADDVCVRYMLADLFAEHFPELDDMEFGKTLGLKSAGNRGQYLDIPGYVYLIESEYGYKIGKTVNIKSRTRLFEVKLPFPIKLINYSWFDSYSKAERELHVRFAHKRREGEWFDLDQADLDYIKSQGAQIPVAGL